MKRQTCGWIALMAVVVGIGADSPWNGWAQQVDARLAALEAKVGIENSTYPSETMIGAEFGWTIEEQQLFDRVMTHQQDKHRVDAATINYMGSVRQPSPATIGMPAGLTSAEQKAWANMIRLRRDHH